MKFLLDANIPYSTKIIFQELKLDIEHTKDIGLQRAKDLEISEYAIKTERILVTKDLEFIHLLLDLKTFPPGVIVLRLPSYFNAQQFNHVVKDFLQTVELSVLKNAIAIVKIGRYRIRTFRKS